MTINQHGTNREGTRAMQGYIDMNQVVIRARINERRAEAAGERLAATARATTTRGSIRRRVGVMLIHAGQRVAGGQASAGSPAAHRSRGLAA
jgi:hypothetical protein